ncbi:hypothetical protein BC940DRAFT_313624 [Gongronella butleri]|nr:hypothetical protein BC940DRAFT_313624 [Gongronella butleri]
MSRQHQRRVSLRKEQSLKDKLKHIDTTSSVYYGKLAMVHPLVISMQEHPCLKIPLEFIDMTAAFIATLMSGQDYLLSIHTSGSLAALDSFRSHVNFIRRTLSRAQISYHSLIVCLFYIDQWFHRRRKLALPSTNWSVRDLFLASIIVAEKYWVDCTWSSQGWSECTQYQYSIQKINALERQFLMEMDYTLSMSDQAYDQFCQYLDFRVHVRQFMLMPPVARWAASTPAATLALSYHNLQILSSPLTQSYAQRLHLSLRPLDAMLLFTKITISVSIVYAAAIVASALLYHYAAQIVIRALWDQFRQQPLLSGVANDGFTLALACM